MLTHEAAAWALLQFPMAPLPRPGNLEEASVADQLWAGLFVVCLGSSWWVGCGCTAGQNCVRLPTYLTLNFSPAAHVLLTMIVPKRFTYAVVMERMVAVPSQVSVPPVVTW